MQAIANTPALKSHLETQVNFLTELSQKTCDSMRQLSELNLHLAQQIVDDTVTLGRSLLECADPFQVSSATMSGIQPAAEHLRGYQQQLMATLAGAGAELGKSAQSHLPEATRSATEAAGELVRTAAAAGTSHNA